MHIPRPRFRSDARRSPFLSSIGRGILAAIGVAVFGGAYPLSPPFPSDTPPPYKSANPDEVRFRTPAEADARRQTLIKYVWPDGLPAARPAVTANIPFPSGNLSGVKRSLVATVDRLDVNVAGMDFHSIAYLLKPANAAHADQLAIVHHGHAADWNTIGIPEVANSLLERGFNVLAMGMPLTVWNTDKTIALPGGGGSVTLNLGEVPGHNELFNKLQASIDTGVLRDGVQFRFFLEPVIQNINYFKNTLGAYGKGRRQILVNNLRDSIPVQSGTYVDSYKQLVAQIVRNDLREGQWSHVRDDAATTHEISAWALKNVILPAMTMAP